METTLATEMAARECACGGGKLRVEAVVLNPRFLFVCCPRGQAGFGGCGFMEWWDAARSSLISSTASPPPPPSATSPPPTPASPPTATPPTSPPPTATPPTSPPPTATPSISTPPPPPPPLTCPCGAGPCSVGTAKNGQRFYFCSSCKYRKWCDARSSSKCYICGEEGHWYMDCPRLPPSTNANNPIICFYCKQQDDHYAAHCPFKRLRTSTRRN